MMLRKPKRRPMFLVKMGKDNTAERAFRLDNKGQLLKSKGEYVQPQNMHFRIATSILRELIGQPDFDGDKYYLEKIRDKNNSQDKESEEIPPEYAMQIPGNHHELTEQSSENTELFKTFDALLDLEYSFDGWDL